MSKTIDQNASLSDKLYDGECEDCGRILEWKFQPDTDSPRWTASCSCGRHVLRVSRVKHTFYSNE